MNKMARTAFIAVALCSLVESLQAQDCSTPKPKGPVDLTPIKELPRDSPRLAGE